MTNLRESPWASGVQVAGVEGIAKMSLSQGYSQVQADGLDAIFLR